MSTEAYTEEELRELLTKAGCRDVSISAALEVGAAADGLTTVTARLAD